MLPIKYLKDSLLFFMFLDNIVIFEQITPLLEHALSLYLIMIILTLLAFTVSTLLDMFCITTCFFYVSFQFYTFMVFNKKK